MRSSADVLCCKVLHCSPVAGVFIAISLPHGDIGLLISRTMSATEANVMTNLKKNEEREIAKVLLYEQVNN